MAITICKFPIRRSIRWENAAAMWIYSARLAARMGFDDECFSESVDEMIDRRAGFERIPGCRASLASGWSAKATFA